MIISHEHRFVFVKTRKTAGTSVEIALSTRCGDEDVVTAITPEDEVLRRRCGGRGRQNTLVPEGAGASQDGDRHFYNHMPAADIRAVVGPECWSAYRTFTVERNPWEKAVSLYFWRTKDLPQRPPFSVFLRSEDRGLLSNWRLYADGDEVLVDRILRHERLDADLAEEWSALGLAGKPTLPRAKAGHRPDDDWHALYTADDAAFVAEVCRREIDRLGYELSS